MLWTSPSAASGPNPALRGREPALGGSGAQGGPFGPRGLLHSGQNALAPSLATLGLAQGYSAIKVHRLPRHGGFAVNTALPHGSSAEEPRPRLEGREPER